MQKDEKASDKNRRLYFKDIATPSEELRKNVSDSNEDVEQMFDKSEKKKEALRRKYHEKLINIYDANRTYMENMCTQNVQNILVDPKKYKKKKHQSIIINEAQNEEEDDKELMKQLDEGKRKIDEQEKEIKILQEKVKPLLKRLHYMMDNWT